MEPTKLVCSDVLTPHAPVNATCKVAFDENDDIYVSSVWIAEYMGRQHKNVLKTIDGILSTALFEGQYAEEIKEATYEDIYRRPQKCYHLNLSGFFFYCTKINMTPEQMMEWGRIITNLDRALRDRSNKTIATLNQKIAAQANSVGLTNMSREDKIAIGMQAAMEVINEHQQTIVNQQIALAKAQPAIEYANAVSASDDTCLVRELAKMISQTLIANNLGTSFTDKELYAWLRANGYVSKQKGSSWNKPLKKATDAQLLKVTETTYQDGNGKPRSSFTTRVTGVGRQFFVDTILQIYKNGGTINGIQGHEVRPDVHDCDGPDECVGEDSAAKGA